MQTTVFFIFFLLLTWGSLSEGATPLPSLLPQAGLPDGWILMKKPETYTRKTLFHRINGQAELFFQYGYQRSIFGIYQNKKKTDEQIELDIYDMGQVLQAFGIFSRFKNEERPINIGLDSFIDEQSALFYKGRCFVMLFSTQPNSPFLKPFASLVASRILNASPPPSEIALFPKERLKPASIQYFPGGLLGKAFLGRGFQGTYLRPTAVGMKRVGQVQEMKLFMALFENPSKARQAFTFFKDDLLKRGRVDQFTTERLKGEDPYQGNVLVVTRRNYLLGAVGFDEKEGSWLLDELIKNFDLKRSLP